MKSPLAITAAVATFVALAAAAMLLVLTAFAGRDAGLDNAKAHGCARPAAAFRGVASPGYEAQLRHYRRCLAAQGR